LLWRSGRIVGCPLLSFGFKRFWWQPSRTS